MTGYEQFFGYFKCQSVYDMKSFEEFKMCHDIVEMM
jgi:hypothetical protein